MAAFLIRMDPNLFANQTALAAAIAGGIAAKAL